MFENINQAEAEITPRLLLHICCAPCAIYPVEQLRLAGFDVHGYWYNPNIQPWSEHEARRSSLVAYSKLAYLPVYWENGYDTVQFMRLVSEHERQGERCALCYVMRLEKTAARAEQLGIKYFTTSLLISPYQDQKLLREAGEAAAEKHGRTFYFENFRRGYAQRGPRAREYGLYLQQYCGCLYSEFERFSKLPINEAERVVYENI